MFTGMNCRLYEENYKIVGRVFRNITDVVIASVGMLISQWGRKMKIWTIRPQMYKKLAFLARVSSLTQRLVFAVLIVIP